MRSGNITTVTDIRPLSGAAAERGPESDLIAEFVEHYSETWQHAIIATEVPIREGVVDLLRIELHPAHRGRSVRFSSMLSEIDDRSLFALAAFRPNQKYLVNRFRESKSDWKLVTNLADKGLVVLHERTVVRPLQFADEIARVTAYEFKLRVGRVGLRQAALRCPAVSRSYLVTRPPGPRTNPDIREFDRLGVGWITLDKGPAHRVAPATRSSPRWARFLIARAIARGLRPVF